MIYPKTQSGSTLILALLIISVISSIAFAAGQLFVSEVRIASGLEDSSSAYYTAETGVNEAISNYRSNRNYQRCVTSPCTSSPSNGGIDTSLNSGRYNLKVWYLGKVAGDTSGNGTVGVEDFPTDSDYSMANLKLNNNESRLFDLSYIVKKPDGSPLDDGDLDLYFRYYNCTGAGVTANDKCLNIAGNGGVLSGPLIEIRLLSATFPTPFVRLVDGVLTGTQATSGAITQGVVKEAIAGSGFTSNKVFKIESLISRIPYQGFKRDLQALEIKTFGADLALAFVARDPNVPAALALADQGLTTIESSGFFGRAKRKLQAAIDRSSGSLIGIFDFTLYSQSGI